MALKPIVGEIKSQDLNDNFSYLDERIVEGGTDPELEGRVAAVEMGLASHKDDNAAHGATPFASANRIAIRDETGGARFDNFGLSPTRSTIDLNDRLANGWSTVNSNTPNTPEEGVQGILITSMWDNKSAGFQLFNVLGQDRFYVRRRSNSTWYTWLKIWHSGNTIVDTNGFIKEV